MKSFISTILRIALFFFVVYIWWWVWLQSFPGWVSWFLIIGCVLLVVPVVWLGRLGLDRQPTLEQAVRMNDFVHYSLFLLLGVAIVEAIKTRAGWMGWRLPIPLEVGHVLVVVTGLFTTFVVLNLAIKGLGAPFAVKLTEKLTADWLYAWTRNPMVLGFLAFMASLGIWYQSTLFVVWVLVLLTPAWIAFLKVFEERELEIRFGESYLEYKAKTPMLFPRKSRK
ncbi:MAG: methyltransferase [Anaerolineaceae bacterium]|jgi:protein-S-isoprenylcysteine O-methyltransferase Ste14